MRQRSGGYWIQLIPLGCDRVHGRYEIHCLKNTWSYCGEMSPAMRNSVIAQALPNPTNGMFACLATFI